MHGRPRHGEPGVFANSAGGQRIANRHGFVNAIRHIDAKAIRHIDANPKGDSTETGSAVDHASQRKR